MCGIIGIVDTKGMVNESLYEGLTVLQHRGQDSAGLMTSEGGKVYLRKDNGLVRDVFQARHMVQLKGGMGIGHVRYPTAGSDSRAEAQPFFVNAPFGIALSHNGNLTNVDGLRREMFSEDFRQLNTMSDSEVLLNVFAHELNNQLHRGQPRLEAAQVFEAVRGVYRRCRGGYAVVAMIVNFGLVAFRDPFGIRPLVYGRGGGGHMFASESIAMDVLGYSLERQVNPGEAVVVQTGGTVRTESCAASGRHAPCLFEFVYFSRPDSILDSIPVYRTRMRMGEKLGEKIKREWAGREIDVVIPVPDTSRIAAVELAQVIGVKYREGLIKNRYIGRTFIMPGQAERSLSVRRKLNAIESEFRGRNVLLVDDSVVRGTTSRQIIQMARDNGAKKVFFASAAPPVRHPNVYGIDMPAAAELVAHGRDAAQVCEFIGADHLVYQELADLEKSCALNGKIHEFEGSCFHGKYVTDDVSAGYLEKVERLRGEAGGRPARGSVLDLAELSDQV